MKEIRAIIGRGGRVNIPAEHQKALGFRDGDEVLIGVVGGSLRIQTRRAALARARSLVRRRTGERAEARAGVEAETNVEVDE